MLSFNDGFLWSIIIQIEKVIKNRENYINNAWNIRNIENSVHAIFEKVTRRENCNILYIKMFEFCHDYDVKNDQNISITKMWNS